MVLSDHNAKLQTGSYDGSRLSRRAFVCAWVERGRASDAALAMHSSHDVRFITTPPAVLPASDSLSDFPTIRIINNPVFLTCPDHQADVCVFLYRPVRCAAPEWNWLQRALSRLSVISTDASLGGG